MVNNHDGWADLPRSEVLCNRILAVRGGDMLPSCPSCVASQLHLVGLFVIWEAELDGTSLVQPIRALLMF